MARLVRVALTLGDPRGIGPEVGFAALSRAPPEGCRVTYFGPGWLAREAPAGSEFVAVGPGGRGSGDEWAGRTALAAIEEAVAGARAGSYDAIVTAPVHKPSLRAAGVPFPGHTELLGELAGVERTGMLMTTAEEVASADGGAAAGRVERASGADGEAAASRVTRATSADGEAAADRVTRATSADGEAAASPVERASSADGEAATGRIFAGNPAAPLRVLLATTHHPLSEVPALVTRELLVSQSTLLARELRKDWRIESPRIALCALNPHASDGGLFGNEEAAVYGPAVAELERLGINVAGPVSADTVFLRALGGEFDAVVAPYHDVGMAAFKTAAFGAGVNVTLGLPFVRTSPDHGTAFDIAGSGGADPSSMIEALALAVELARARAGRRRIQARLRDPGPRRGEGRGRAPDFSRQRRAEGSSKRRGEGGWRRRVTGGSGRFPG